MKEWKIPERLDIVECETFPMVFAGGPGTLKTTYCRAHCEYLRDKGYSVLMLSFTNAAADQLSVTGIESYTIDGFYYRCLRRWGKLEGDVARPHAYRLREELFSELIRNPLYLNDLLGKWTAVVLDEGQDASYRELKNLFIISGGDLHVFCDVDQCIYEWRNAEPLRLLDFCEYQGIKPIWLDYTSRLTHQILKASQGVIRNNVHRFDVPLWSDKDGPEIEFVQTIHDVEATMSRLKEVNSNDVAVLCRNLKGRQFVKDFWDQGLSKKAESHKPYAGTIHGAKGLEWLHVFLTRADVSEYSHGPIEEERRVFYTGMTRTCSLLHISAFNPIGFIREGGLVQWADSLR